MQKNLNLYYFVPYRTYHNEGGYYKSDYGYTRYADASDYKSYSAYQIFETKEQLADWFCQHAEEGYNIPTIYIARFIGRHLSVDDVIEITNLKDNTIGYYTVLDEETYAAYDDYRSKLRDAIIWERRPLGDEVDVKNQNFRVKAIYEALKERDVQMKHDISDPEVNREEEFFYRGSLQYAYDDTISGKVVLNQPGKPNVKIKKPYMDLR